MRSVNSSSLSQAWNCLAADRKQDNYPPCSPAVPGGPALSRIRAWGGGGGRYESAPGGRPEFNRFELGDTAKAGKRRTQESPRCR